MALTLPFEELDYVYTPSSDVQRDAKYFTDVLGGHLIFAVEGMGTRVAAIQLSEKGPLVLLADHLQGDAPILIYRVPNLSAAVARLNKNGWHKEATFEIPPGPCCAFRTPGGQRIAVYQLTRPDVQQHFGGRRDF